MMQLKWDFLMVALEGKGGGTRLFPAGQLAKNLWMGCIPLPCVDRKKRCFLFFLAGIFLHSFLRNQVTKVCSKQLWESEDDYFFLKKNIQGTYETHVFAFVRPVPSPVSKCIPKRVGWRGTWISQSDHIEHHCKAGVMPTTLLCSGVYLEWLWQLTADSFGGWLKPSSMFTHPKWWFNRMEAAEWFMILITYETWLFE